MNKSIHKGREPVGNQVVQPIIS